MNITVPSSLGYKQFNFTGVSPNITEISILTTNPLLETDAQIHVSIPFGLSKRFTVEPTLFPISRLDYHIHSHTIWDLDPYFNISIVAFDAHNSFNIGDDIELAVSITLESDTVSLLTTLSKVSFTKLVTLRLPQSWFTTLQPDTYLLKITSHNASLINTTIPLNLITSPTPDLNVPLETRPLVIIALPHHPLYTGSTAVMSVHFLADTGVRYFIMRFSYPLSSRVINLDPSLQWEFSNTSNFVAISGFINLPKQAGTSSKLFDIYLSLLSDDREVSCELSQAFDEHFNPLLPDNSPSQCYFSGPLGLSSPTGYLNLIPESVTRIVAYPRQSILYNHAVLSQSAVRTPIYTYLYTSRGVKKYNTGPQLVCTSSSVETIRVDSACSYLYFNGSELYGSDNISIRISYMDLTTEVYVRVFYPDLPITLSLIDPILNSIHSYPGKDRCDSKFQSSRILAYTNFTTPCESVHNVDVLNLVINSLSISDTRIANLRDGMYLAGMSAGTGSIILNSISGLVGETQFTVSDDPVEISCYSPHVYTDIEVNSNSFSLATTPHMSQSLRLSFPQRFIFNTTRGFTLILLRYSDSNTELINAYNLNGMNIVDNTFILLNETSLTFSLPTTCPLVLSLSFITPIRLQQPDDVIISLSNKILTIENNLAVSFGYQTFATLTVHLVFGSEMIQTSNPPFVTISIQNTNILDLVYTQQNAILRTKATGTTDITVSVSPFSVTKHIAIQIVSLSDDLRIKLYLSYSNSTQETSVLSRVSADMFQIGEISVEAVLTNQQAAPIDSDDTNLYYEVREVDGSSDSPGPITDKAYFVGNRLYVNSSLVTVDTNIELVARYNASLERYSVLLSTNTLSVISLTNFDIIPDLNGVIGSQFPINFGLTLSDDTFFPRYFQNVAIYPGLVCFELSDPRPISFDSSTGMLTLIDNSKDLVYITAEIGNVSVMSNSFAVNLAPVGNYIDIGSEEGLALPHRLVNDKFAIPIWLQTYTYFKSVDISLAYNSAILSIISVNPDISFSGGLFLSDSSVGGEIRFGGVPPLPLSGARLLVAEIEFSSSQPQEADIIATVNSLSGPFPLYSNILTENSIRLTNLTQVVTSSRSVRSSDRSSHERTRVRRNQVCIRKETTVSGRDICIECSIEVKGDVNRDCRFDLSDVSYLLDYVTASYTGFSSTTGQLIKEEVDQLPLSRVDINEDGAVSISDVNYLNWVNFGLFYFFQSVQTELSYPTQSQLYEYDCELIVSVSLMDTSVNNDRFYTYIEVSQASSHSNQFLNQVDPIQGAFIANTSRDGVISRIYLTDGLVVRYIIPGSFVQDIGISPILVATDGSQFLYQTFTNRSSTANYPDLRADLPIPGEKSNVSVYIPGGYSPYFTFKPPTVCGAPQNVSLEVIGEVQARELKLYWPGTGGRGPFVLKKVFCGMIGRESNITLPCAGVVKEYQDIFYPEFSDSNLNPYSVYHFRMEVEGRASQWTQFFTAEAAPESILPPTLQRYNTTCIYTRWEEPEKPNGLILDYTLFLNQTVVRVDGRTRSYLLCGVTTEGVHDVLIQASNSAGSARSKQIQATFITSVIAIRLNVSCVELNWTQLVFNVTSHIQEVFIISIDNSTVSVDYNDTRIIVCDLITDGVPFYLDIISSRVGKLFSGSLSLPIPTSAPISTLLLVILIPILVAILLFVCCIALAICCWRSYKHGFFNFNKKDITAMKSVDFWSTEEEFVEITPSDIGPLERRLPGYPPGRDRSSTFGSSDSWMNRDPLSDAERGEVQKEYSKESFDSGSFYLSEKQSDTASYNNNNTLVSEDRTLSQITPRKAHSLKGRERLSGTGADLRKVRMRHSWHNLRHKRFFKRDPSKQLTPSPSKSASELYQNTNSEPNDDVSLTIVCEEDTLPKQILTPDTATHETQLLQSEVYENPTEISEDIAETPFLGEPPDEVIANPTSIILAQEIVEEAEPNPFMTQEITEDIEPSPILAQDIVEDLIPNLPQEVTEKVDEAPLSVQEPVEEVISNPILTQAEEIIETQFSAQAPVEEIISTPLLTQEAMEMISTPQPTQERIEGFYKPFSTPETIEEVTSELLSTGGELTSTPLSTQGEVGEATLLDLDTPGRRVLATRPSIDLTEGYVMDMAHGYEKGSIPLQENRPYPMVHNLSFTELPEEDSVLSRRSIFQSPGHQQSLLLFTSNLQSMDISEEPTTPSDEGEASDTENAEFSTE